MKLSYLLSALSLTPASEIDGIEGLQLDSRQVKPNEVFIAVRGGERHGLEFADSAIKNGAVAIFSDEPQDKIYSVPFFHCPDLVAKLAELADRFWPLARHIKIIGVTGTNGKTSTVWMLSHAFERLGKPSARLGTLGQAFKNSSDKSQLTTGSVFDNYRYLDWVASKEGHYAAMEVSSHALVQNRVAGLTIDTAIFSNLSHDHLDYHGTMEAYAEAKSRLFSSEGLRWAIVHINDHYAQKMIEAVNPTAQLITYGINNTDADINATNVTVSLQGASAWLDTPWGCGVLEITPVGSFQLENALSVIAALCTHAVPLHKALAVCRGIPGVPGRLECIELSNQITVVIDYSHTPDALQTALETLRACQATGKLWCVFGCGGNRDTAKRELMGKIAEQYSDHQIITNDNPRWESPEVIAENILAGMTKAPDSICLDRKAAIEFAVSHAEPGDIILVAGKGHELTQEIQGKQYALSDREVVLSLKDEKEKANEVV